MPANVQSMFYVGKMPWHKEGKALKEPPDTITAIKTAGLDWSVKKVKFYSEYGAEIKNYYGIERSDTGKILGIVKNDYVPLQNTEAFDFFDPLISNKFFEYETAGALGDGEIIWILAKIKHNGSSFAVQNKDEIVKYLLLSNSHDGESAVNIKFTPIRVVCQNTLNIALEQGRTVNIKHLAGMYDKLDNIQQVIRNISLIYTHIEGCFNKMAKCRVDHNKVNTYFNLIYPIEEKHDMTKEQLAETEKNIKIREHLMNNFENATGVKELNIGGTLWAAYNAVTQYIDHPDKYKLGDNKLLKRIWFGEGEAIKKKAYLSAVRFLSAV